MYEWKVVLYGKYYRNQEQTVDAYGDTIEDAKDYVKRNYGCWSYDIKSVTRVDD